ncbi:hypothetical protein GCM10009554_54670 [Kribbella koreensis]|uniref:Secreted protein n=1 Tax=Kribbella koreensis TaxID=57909 RepID=A0ABP4BMW0_9ACTN
MTRKHSLGALATIALAIALAGCGSDTDGQDNQVASGSGAQPTTSTSAGAGTSPGSEGLSRDEKSVKFTQCLREHGIDVPDPEPGKGPMIKLDPSSGISQEDMQKAMEDCQEFNPQGEAGPDPQQEENGRKFAACMREHGVEKFPDPKPGQRGVMIDRAAGEDPDFPKAQEACQPILAGK